MENVYSSLVSSSFVAVPQTKDKTTNDYPKTVGTTKDETPQDRSPTVRLTKDQTTKDHL